MESFSTHSAKRVVSKMSVAAISAYIVFGSTLLGAIPVAKAATVSLFSDNFGTGSSANDIPDWDEEGFDSASSTLAQAFAGSGEDTVSPDGGRFAKIGEDEWICRVFSTSLFDTYTNPSLSYYVRGDADAESSDDGIVEFRNGSSCTAGSGWSNAATYDLNTNVGSWSGLQTVSVPTGSFGSTFALRFRTSSSSSDEYFRVDGVSFTGDNSDGTITIIKQTIPDGDPTDFTFTGDIVATLSDGESSAPVTVAPGTYSVTETDFSDWRVTNITCDDGNSTGDVNAGTITFNVEANEDVTCTITNTLLGRLNVLKVANNDDIDGTVFNFSSPTPAEIPNFSIDTFASNQHSVYVLPGTYTVNEDTPPTDWTMDSNTCVDVSVAAGAVVDCTITNTYITAPVVPTCNGLPVTISGTGTINGTSGNDVIMGSPLSDTINGFGGNDTICAGDGHDAIDGGSGNDDIFAEGGNDSVLGGLNSDDLDGGAGIDYCNGGLGADDIENCEETGLLRGIIVIEKDAQPDSEEMFSFSGDLGAFSIGDGGFHWDDRGTGIFGNDFTVTENSAEGWVLDSIVCHDPGGSTVYDLDSNSVEIDLDATEVVTCVFTNIQEVSACGNETIEEGEQCDDGNAMNGDGCSSTCQNQALACTPTDEDLLAYLRLDEATGPTATDSSGNGNAGAWMESPASGTGAPGLGFYNGASIDFNGTSYVDIGDALDMGTGDMSVSLWFNTTDADYSLFSKSFYGGAASRFFAVDEGTGLYAGFHGTSIVETTPRIMGLNDGDWHHVVVTYDRDGSMTLYVDNAAVATADISAQSAHDMQSAYDMYLGRYNDAVDGTNPHPSTLALDGMMDDVRFYGRALSGDEVDDLFGGSCDVTEPAVACAVTDSNLVAHWKFDEGSSSSAADSTDYNNEGIHSGGWSSSAPSTLFNNPFVASFDGSDDVVSVPDTTDLNFDSTDPFTGSAWVNPTAFGGYQTVLHKLDDSTSAYRGYLLTLNNGVPEVWLINDYTGGSYMVVPATGSLSAGVWQHVGFTYDGSGTSGGVHIYVNGSDMTGSPSVDALAGGFSTTSPFEMGLRSFFPIQPFSGLMDDVRIYDVVLNGTQFSALAGGQCDAGVTPPDTDQDDDGVEDGDDNCVEDANADQTDTDEDGQGDVCDSDDDDDGVVDAIDNCDLVPNEDQSNEDEDAFGDACDEDFEEETTSFTVPGDETPNPGNHRGSRTNMLQGAANFLTGNMPGGAFGGIAPGAFGGDSDEPLTDDEMRVICSLRKALPSSVTSTMYEWLALYLAPIMNRDADTILEALRDASLCAAEARAEARVSVAKPFKVDAAGYPVSSNPTWNACIMNKVTLKDIRNNPDKDEDGLGRDCSYYHTGALWKHPDLNVYFTFDRKKRTVKLPAGYVVEKEQAVSQL